MTVRRPTVAGRDLGSELREIREERGLSMREVARRLDWPASKLSKIETGKQGTKREDVASLLAIYGITGQRRDYLVNKAGKVDKPGHWEKSGLDGGLSRETRTLIRLERDAIQIDPERRAAAHTRPAPAPRVHPRPYEGMRSTGARYRGSCCCSAKQTGDSEPGTRPCLSGFP